MKCGIVTKYKVTLFSFFLQFLHTGVNELAKTTSAITCMAMASFLVKELIKDDHDFHYNANVRCP
jgi:hypothetical protein